MAYRQDLFTHVINQLNGGAVAEEASQKLNQLVRNCQDTGKPGEITFKMKIVPEGNTGQYMITDDIKTTDPKFPRAKTLLFGTPDGNLDSVHQKQGSFFDRNGTVKEVINVEPDTTEVKEL